MLMECICDGIIKNMENLSHTSLVGGQDMMYDALYGRQSIEKKDSISVESQLEYCRYETHGDPYIEYADRGFSGKNTNRPDFEKMMNDIRAGKIKRVIVYKLAVQSWILLI